MTNDACSHFLSMEVPYKSIKNVRIKRSRIPYQYKIHRKLKEFTYRRYKVQISNELYPDSIFINKLWLAVKTFPATFSFVIIMFGHV